MLFVFIALKDQTMSNEVKLVTDLQLITFDFGRGQTNKLHTQSIKHASEAKLVEGMSPSANCCLSFCGPMMN